MRIFFILIFIFSSSLLRAETLQKVEFIGNKRTSVHSLILHGQIKIGEDLTPKRLQEIKDNLSRINQISLKNIEFKEGILKIEIQEKWTLFPVPMITRSGNYHSTGILIYEDNLLGTLGTLASGLLWTNSHFNYIFYYQNESLFTPQTGIKLLTMKRTEFIEFSRGETIINQHESYYNYFLITPNYVYKDNVFKLGPIVVNKKIYDHNGTLLFKDVPRGLFFRHHLNAFKVMDVMYKGFVTTFDLYVLKSQSNKNVLRTEADIYWSKPLGENFLNFDLHGHYITDRSYIFPKYLGGDEGYRGYDKSSLPASSNFGLITQYQQHLFKKVFLAPFYEYNNSKLITPILSGTRLSESTVGIGIHYYLKKISIPSVIFDAARNIDDRSFHFHLNIGISI